MITIERKIVKIGNSLGVRIPSSFLKELGVTFNDTIEMEFDSNLKTIIIKNKSTTPDNNYLETIVKGIVDQYLKEKDLL
ncbi:AbrB/MazE/SpoVT family DNA-binding domain-containing protein [uncultured Metabacillus sp.]|uniref:AbrB/MazE/SpoVT family DNA-binding domain-containing protein n=1 Tax=uncultured Metabacillus sp. TaxID=2860135 RepID=UPI0026027DC9|nr:AbrB/MazE/SpoVT family DNA-binding domain-containing protein [uncultured Metabacillus sp.]